MAINKKLIHFKSKQKFNEELANGNILETSIVFILDTKEIYTHGQFYDGSTFDPYNIEASIQNIINTKADKNELPTKTSDLTNDSGFITINDVSVGNLLKTYTFYVDNIRGSIDVYTITQSELEEIQNADIVYIFINDSKKKIQLTSKTENNSISFLGYDFGSYPSTVFSISITVVKDSDNIEVRICIDSIGLDDYISESVGTSYAAGVCLSEEFVDGAEIAIVDNIDLILNSALNNFRPVILTLINSNNDKGVLLHGPYMLYSSDYMPSIKFIGLFNDLTIECVLRHEDGYLYGTLHIKSQSEGGNTTIEGGSSDTYYLALPLGEDGQCLSSGTLTQEQFEEMASCKTLIVRTSNMSSDGISASEDIAFDWRVVLIEQSDESEMKGIICSNIYPNPLNNCLTSYIFIFSSNGSECIYELIAKLIFLDSDIFDPTAVHLSDKSIYELNIPDNTESGEISEEEFNLIISSKTLILNVGMHKIVCIQRTAPEVYPDTYYFYGNFFEGVELKIVLSLLRRDGVYIYTIQTKELSSGGTIDTSNSSSAYPLVEIETYSGGLDSGYETINPNTFYVLRGDDDIGSTGQVEIKLGEATTGVANEYLFLFTSGSTPTSLTLPGNIKWINTPNIGTNKIYLISILNGLGTILEFDV